MTTVYTAPYPNYKKSITVPEETEIDLYSGMPKEVFMTLNPADAASNVNLLSQHMDIIAESRELIKKGKTISWDQFVKEDDEGK